MGVTSGLLSVAEFARLPQPAKGVRQELHHGQLVEMPPVKKRHTKLQKRLVSLLGDAIDQGRFGVDKEFPFRPAPEYEVWVADVAVFSLALWDETSDDDYFRGVPEIVIEVLSPSNSATEMRSGVLGGGSRSRGRSNDPSRRLLARTRDGGFSGMPRAGHFHWGARYFLFIVTWSYWQDSGMSAGWKCKGLTSGPVPSFLRS
jgi:hypothetical protein